MRRSRNFREGWGGGGGGGVVPMSICHIKISENVFLLFFLFVFSPQPILQTPNGLFKKKMIIFQGSRGGSTLFRGGGWGIQPFSRGVGVQLLIP